MALANISWILASNGYRVLTIDWDLEAPGLPRFFQPFLDDHVLASTPGLIDFFADYVESAVSPRHAVPAIDGYLTQDGRTEILNTFFHSTGSFRITASSTFCPQESQVRLTHGVLRNLIGSSCTPGLAATSSLRPSRSSFA
jgi:hypothetical protein